MPAFDLSGMYKDLAESIPGYGNVAKGAMQHQELMNRDLEYKKAKEDFEAQKGLRALFAQNPNASVEEAAQYSPAFAQELMKNRFAMQKDLLGMEETKQKMEKGQKEMSEMDRKIVSETLGPIAEHALITGDMEGYKQAVGRAASDLKSRGISLPMNFDPAQHTPDAVLRNATGGGYRSQLLEQQRDVATQQQLAQVPNRPSGGTVQTTPEGFQLPVGPGTNLPPNGPPMGGGYGGGQQPLFRNPPTGTGLANPNANVGPGAGVPQPPQTQPQLGQPGQPEPEPNIPEQDIARFQEIYRSLPPGREKDAAAHALANSVKRILPNGGVHEDQGQVITPEKLAEIRRTEEQNKADIQTKALEERKTAESEIERQQSRQKAIEAFSLVPPLKEVEDLILKSTSGKKQKQAAGLFEEYTGKSTPGMRNIGKLGPIAGRLRDAVNRAPGSQSDKDAIIESLKTGNIENPEIAAETRVESYKEFVRQMREMIKNQTGLDATSSAEETSGQGPVKVKSASEAANLPPGTLFMKEDGTLHRRK